MRIIRNSVSRLLGTFKNIIPVLLVGLLVNKTVFAADTGLFGMADGIAADIGLGELMFVGVVMVLWISSWIWRMSQQKAHWSEILVIIVVCTLGFGVKTMVGYAMSKGGNSNISDVVNSNQYKR